ALRVEETASSKPTRTPIRPHLRAERAPPAERQAKRLNPHKILKRLIGQGQYQRPQGSY
ncbi:MAG: hypothetical protein ACI9C2_001220, partial [Gammaproteobacteria bacterium]